MAKDEKPKAKKKRKFSSIVLVAGVLLFVAGGLALLNTHWGKDTGTPGLPVADEVTTATTDTPVETKPTEEAVKGYSVPAGQPRSITIKSVGISGIIQKVGITKDNAMAVPSNIHFGGWYTGSVKPGEAGLSIINGHVSGIYFDGIFKQLSGVKANHVIEVEFGDKSIKRFVAVETIVLPAKASSARLFAQNPSISKQLNLITCGGKFDKASNSYADRLIVVAKLDSSSY